jgi:two-component system cell cycle response regulator
LSEKSESFDSRGGFFLKNLPQEHQQILIVDDDTIILNLLGEFFYRLGYKYRIAGDGLEAISMLEQFSATIVVTDLLMPRIDGMELIREIKKLWPETDIIAITGYSRNFSYTDVIKAGACDFIRKPFKLDELEAKLNRIIRERGYSALLKRLSIRDVLTDLYNRRFLNEKLEEEAQRATRQNYPLFIIILDLDNFKELNDTLGHQAGDEVLQRLTDVLSNSIRRNVDIPFRYGGDEFAVMIPQASTEQVIQIAERIRRNYLNEDIGDTSLSLGISQFRRTNRGLREDINEFIYKADVSMYAAKKAGGNKIILHKETKKE